MKKYNVAHLSPELLERIKKLASKGFSEKAIAMMCGLDLQDFYVWKKFGYNSQKTPESVRDMDDDLYAEFFAVITKTPGENFYG